MSGTDRFPDIATVGTARDGTDRTDAISLVPGDIFEDGPSAWIDVQRGEAGWVNVTRLRRPALEQLRDQINRVLDQKS